jgi:hypothetical protein
MPTAGPITPFIKTIQSRTLDEVNAIREEALSLGWDEALLYQNRGQYAFPYGDDYGLVCFLDEQVKEHHIGKISAEKIEIVYDKPPYSSLFFYKRKGVAH